MSRPKFLPNEDIENITATIESALASAGGMRRTSRG